MEHQWTKYTFFYVNLLLMQILISYWKSLVLSYGELNIYVYMYVSVQIKKKR